MLWTIFVILLVLWLLGLVSSYTFGRIHSYPARDRDCGADYPTDLRTPRIITSNR